MVSYWVDWYAPYRTKIPGVNHLAQVLEGQGGYVIDVDFDGLRGAELKKSADSMGVRFAMLADDSTHHFKLPRSEALPVTYIVDAQGEIRQRLLDERTADGILKQLGALREER